MFFSILLSQRKWVINIVGFLVGVEMKRGFGVSPQEQATYLVCMGYI